MNYTLKTDQVAPMQSVGINPFCAGGGPPNHAEGMGMKRGCIQPPPHGQPDRDRLCQRYQGSHQCQPPPPSQ